MGKKLIAAWICLGLLVATGIYMFSYQEKLGLNLARLAHTYEILSVVYDLQNNLNDAEAAARGFIITGEEAQLETYQQALKEVDSLLGSLRQLTIADPEHQRLLKTLQPLIDKRVSLLDKSIELRRQQGFEAREHAVMTREGKKLQDRIRKILDRMEEAEKKLVDPQWAQDIKKTRAWLWVLSVAIALSLALLLFLLYVLNREVSQRRKAQEKLAAQQESLQSLASQLSVAEERERRRIAVYLHDKIGQALALAKIKLGELRKAAGGVIDPQPLSAGLDDLRDLLGQIINDTQTLTFQISSPILHELGLEAALEWLTEQLSKQHGIQAHFESDAQPKPMDDEVGILLYQAASELLVNVVKHAQAQHVKVSLWRDDPYLRLGVDDDGVGFQPGKLNSRWGTNGGFGLFSIRERLMPMGGVLEVESTPGEGTQVTMSVPVKRELKRF